MAARNSSVLHYQIFRIRGELSLDVRMMVAFGGFAVKCAALCAEYGDTGLSRLLLTDSTLVFGFEPRSKAVQPHTVVQESLFRLVRRQFPAWQAQHLPILIGDEKRLQAFLTAQSGRHTAVLFDYRYPVRFYPEAKKRLYRRKQASEEVKRKRIKDPWGPAVAAIPYPKDHIRYLPSALAAIDQADWKNNPHIAEAILSSPEVQKHARMLAGKYSANIEDELVLETWNIFNNKLWAVLDSPKNIYRLLYRVMETTAKAAQSEAHHSLPIYLTGGEDAGDENNSFIQEVLGLTSKSAEENFEEIQLYNKTVQKQQEIAAKLKGNKWPEYLTKPENYRQVGRPPKKEN